MKFVTIGIPFYNNQTTLRDAVNSALHQSYKHLEVILINDGSTDGSLEIAQDFPLKDSRVKVVSDGMNMGLISRLNQLINLATGTYFARMDADDLMDLERIEKQVLFLEAFPDVDVVSTGMISIDESTRACGIRGCDKTDPDFFTVFKNGADILHPSIMARTTWFRRNKYLEGFERAEDRELFTRTLGTSIYKIIPEPLYYYRDIGNMNLNKFLKSYSSERKVLLKNGREKLPLLQLLVLYGRSVAKSAAIRVFFLLNQEHRVFSSKLTPLNKEQQIRFTHAIRTIRT